MAELQGYRGTGVPPPASWSAHVSPDCVIESLFISVCVCVCVCVSCCVCVLCRVCVCHVVSCCVCCVYLFLCLFVCFSALTAVLMGLLWGTGCRKATLWV